MRHKCPPMLFRMVILMLTTVLGACAFFAIDSAVAQVRAPELRLYVLDCGTIIYNNPETYNLTRQEVINTNMSDPCYLVVHPRGSLLFDSGLPDSAVGKPFNEAPLSGRPPTNSATYFMLVTKTLKSQLAQIGFPANKIDYFVLSHSHVDHVGNANDYAGSTWLVQKTEWDFMFGPNVAEASIPAAYKSLKNSKKTKMIEGDYDVFGDGTVVLKYTPGHTPGHQCLYLKLPKTGGVVLSGDIYHYPEELTLGRMPEREKMTETAASRAALATFIKNAKAVLWIGHDINANSKLKKSPEYYD